MSEQVEHARVSHPLHAHLSDQLLVSCITVLEDEKEKLLKFVKNVSLDSSNAIVMEQLEKKLLRALEKRGSEVLQTGWTLPAADASESSRDGCTRKYTPYQLRSVLQLMGLKQLRAHEVARCSFERLAIVCQQLEQKWREGDLATLGGPQQRDQVQQPGGECGAAGVEENGSKTSIHGGGQRAQDPPRAAGSRKAFDVTLTRIQFITLVGYALALTDRYRRKHLTDFIMSCSIRERRSSMIILFGGTSGCGKSTLASLTASRLGITTVLSTDFIRHMLRREVSKEDSPILYASTYNAGESLEEEVKSSLQDPKDLVLRGYSEQSRLVFDRLESVIAVYEARREPLIVEGVHLTMENIAALMEKHPSCIPFLIYISNDVKHRERFAVRAKYMALDSRSNRYIKFFENIRCIQTALSEGADRYLIPKIDNTNVDRSLATIHAIVIKCLRKHFKGKVLWDAGEKKVQVMHEAIQHHLEDAWSSKAMLRTIRSKISKGEVLKRYFKTANLEASEDSEMSRLQETIFSHLLQFPDSREGTLNFDSRTNTDSEFLSDSTSCRPAVSLGKVVTKAAAGQELAVEEVEDRMKGLGLEHAEEVGSRAPKIVDGLQWQDQQQVQAILEEHVGRQDAQQSQMLSACMPGGMEQEQEELEEENQHKQEKQQQQQEQQQQPAVDQPRKIHHRKPPGAKDILPHGHPASHRRATNEPMAYKPAGASKFRKGVHVRWSEDQEQHLNLYPSSHAHALSYRRLNRHVAQLDVPQGSTATDKVHLSPLPRGRRAHKGHSLHPEKVELSDPPPAAQLGRKHRSLSPSRSESTSPTPEGEMENYGNEDDDAATVSVTSEEESASNASAHSNENENGSESESEGRTLFDVDTCSWAPSIDVSQGEEEREMQESTVMVTRGSVNRSSVTSGDSEVDEELRNAS